MFIRLTVHQRSLIEAYLHLAKRVAWLGIDQGDLPVIQFRDLRGDSDAFAIPETGDPVGAVDPEYPLRELTEYEQDHIRPADHELLFSLKRSL